MLNETKEEVTREGGLMYQGPLTLSVLFAGLIFLLLVVVSLMNQQFTAGVVFSLLTTLILYIGVIVTKRYFVYTLLLPIAIAPAALLSLDKQLLAHFLLTAESRVSTTLTSGTQAIDSIYNSLAASPLLLLIFPILIAAYLFTTASVSVVRSSATNADDVLVTEQAISNTAESRGGETHDTASERATKELQTLRRVRIFIAVWQIILIATWLIPTGALFFESRLRLLFVQTYGIYATAAQLLTAMLLFLPWIVVVMMGFLLPIQSLTYYPIILKKLTGEEPSNPKLRRDFRSKTIFYTIVGLALFFLTFLIRFSNHFPFTR